MSTIELPVLVLNPHMALAQTAEAQRPKVDVPDPVVDLLEADVFADADRGDVDPAAVPPHAPVGADVPDFEAVRVLEGRQPIRHRPRRRAVTRRRRLLVDRLMGPLVIELRAEDVEAALLRRETARGRPGRLRFQRAMHPFMPAVLIRAPGLDELRQDPEADPPRRELRQARQRGGGERHAVVAANPPRQPILMEQPREDGLGLDASGRRQGLATQMPSAGVVHPFTQRKVSPNGTTTTPRTARTLARPSPCLSIPKSRSSSVITVMGLDRYSFRARLVPALI